MNAKAMNDSHRLLFISGGRLDLLFDGTPSTDIEHRPEWRRLRDAVDECPCGCGLVGDVCEARREQVKLSDDELPF